MDVIVAASLHKANEIIQAQDFDVLLSDLNADWEGDGLEVLENLREVNPESVTQLGFESTIDALFELLNAGLIKIESDGTGFTDLVPCMVPQPPRMKLRRPGKRGDA